MSSRLWKFIHNTVSHPLLELPFGLGMPFHDWSAQKAFGHLYYLWWLTPDECELAYEGLSFGKFGRFKGSKDVFKVVSLARGRLALSSGPGSIRSTVRGTIPSIEAWPDTPMGKHCAGCAGIIIEAECVRYIRELPGVITDFDFKRVGE